MFRLRICIGVNEVAPAELLACISLLDAALGS